MKGTETKLPIGRTPTRFLDVKFFDMAEPEEVLMVYEEYDFGHLYMISKSGELVDLDVKLQNIDKTNAEKITVIIDDKTYTLYDLLYSFKAELGETVRAKFLEADMVYTEKQYAYDNLSINPSNNIVQIAGFDEAKDGMIPTKQDGKIVWVSPSEESGSITSGIGVGSNADDGRVSNIITIEALNDKIYLMACKRQKTEYLVRNCKVFLPKNTLDSYCEINWCLITYSFSPKLTFEDNVIWLRGTGNLPTPSSTNVYTFKTWDNGKTWMGSVNRFNKMLVTDDKGNTIDLETLKEYFMTREEMETDYYTKEQAEERFIDTEEIEEKYVNKTDMVELISWKDVNNKISDQTTVNEKEGE